MEEYQIYERGSAHMPAAAGWMGNKQWKMTPPNDHMRTIYHQECVWCARTPMRESAVHFTYLALVESDLSQHNSNAMNIITPINQLPAAAGSWY